MIKYRNLLTGRVVEVAEPEERRAELERVRKMGRPLKANKITVEVKRRERTIAKLGRCHKWQRVSDATPVGMPDSQGGDQDQAVTLREAGGGWYEVLCAGEVIERVRGREAAESARDQAVAELAGT